MEKSGSWRWVHVGAHSNAILEKESGGFNLLVSWSLMEYYGEQSSSEIIGYISESLVMKADLVAVTSFLYIKRKHKSDRCHCHKWNARQFVVDDKIFESTKSNRSVAWRRVINWMFPTSIHLELLQTNEAMQMVTRDWNIWVGCVHHLRYYNNTKRYT